MWLLRFALVCTLAFPAFTQGDELGRSDPESVGVSSQRLQRLDDAMQAQIDAGRKAGIAVIIARRNKIIHERAFGYAELESKTPLQLDAYFRVYSMTKPIVSVALLMLFEEGKFQLTDPLEQYIPAMKDVKVYAGEDDAGNMMLEAPKRKITIQDVFRHTAGFSYGALTGAPPTNPVERAYVDAGVSYDKLESLRELAEDKMPGLPLLYQPGQRWAYSFAHDVQAYLVEYFSGMSIDRFLHDRICEPLGMHDTFFGEPASGGPRSTTIYGPMDSNGLSIVDRPLGFPHSRFGEHPFGGAGLSMTLMDYAKFAQMLLNGGEFNGTRILGRKTVELMTANHLPPGMDIGWAGWGYGLGVSVCISPAESGNLGSVGQFGWGGAATTWFIVDPQEELVTLVFAQYVPIDFAFINRFRTLVYQTIVE
jgi:CubicO group peptidase (beta-lactamase class C family)